MNLFPRGKQKVIFQAIEPGNSIATGIKNLRFGIGNISAGVATFLFSIAGPIIIMVNLSGAIGMQYRQLVAFVMIGQAVGALISAWITLRYKIPLVMTPSMTAFVVVSSTYELYKQSEVVFGIIIAGVILILLGLTGVLAKAKDWLPMPIVSAMVAGVMLQQPLKIVFSMQGALLPCGIILITFLLTPRLSKKLPQQLTIVVAAALVMIFLIRPQAEQPAAWFAWPQTVVPKISFGALSVCIPLVLIAVSDCVSGYGILRSNEFDAPINCILACSGIASIMTSFALCPAVTLVSVGTAITSGDSAGPREYRYAGSLVKSACSFAMSIFAATVLSVISLLPSFLTNIMSGLMVVDIVIRSMRTAFSGKSHQYGAFAAFLVGVSQVSFAGISTSLLSLLSGMAVSVCLDQNK